MIEFLYLVRDFLAIIGFVTVLVLAILFICSEPEPKDNIKRGRGPLG